MSLSLSHRTNVSNTQENDGQAVGRVPLGPMNQPKNVDGAQSNVFPQAKEKSKLF